LSPSEAQSIKLVGQTALIFQSSNHIIVAQSSLAHSEQQQKDATWPSEIEIRRPQMYAMLVSLYDLSLNLPLQDWIL